MEWLIKRTFDDPTKPNSKGNLVLSTNAPLSPYELNYPIKWQGFINSHRIEILQKDEFTYLRDCLLFEIYPENYEHLKTLIEELIISELDRKLG